MRAPADKWPCFKCGAEVTAATIVGHMRDVHSTGCTCGKARRTGGQEHDWFCVVAVPLVA
jgi:hypothetical protein